MKILYEAQATATGGRNGRTRSDNGRVDLQLGPPTELGGEDPEATNPEELFAAGYAGCFHSAVQLVASGKKVDAEGSSVTARVGLGSLEGGGFGLQVALDVALPAADREAAERVVARAHRACPYSNAIKGNVDVELLVDGEPLAAAAPA